MCTSRTSHYLSRVSSRESTTGSASASSSRLRIPERLSSSWTAISIRGVITCRRRELRQLSGRSVRPSPARGCRPPVAAGLQTEHPRMRFMLTCIFAVKLIVRHHETWVPPNHENKRLWRTDRRGRRGYWTGNPANDGFQFERRPNPVLSPTEPWEGTLTANASVLVLGE